MIIIIFDWLHADQCSCCLPTAPPASASLDQHRCRGDGGDNQRDGRKRPLASVPQGQARDSDNGRGRSPPAEGGISGEKQEHCRILINPFSIIELRMQLCLANLLFNVRFEVV